MIEPLGIDSDEKGHNWNKKKSIRSKGGQHIKIQAKILHPKCLDTALDAVERSRSVETYVVNNVETLEASVPEFSSEGSQCCLQHLDALA